MDTLGRLTSSLGSIRSVVTSTDTCSVDKDVNDDDSDLVYVDPKKDMNPNESSGNWIDELFDEPFGEYFDLFGEHIKYDKQKKMLTNTYNEWIGDCWKSAYTNSVVQVDVDDSKTYQLSFKIVNKNSSKSAINIGIIGYESDDIPASQLCTGGNFVDDYKQRDDVKYYAYCSNGRKYSHIDGLKHGKGYHETFETGDVIQMKLEFIKYLDFGSLYFKKNKSQWKETAFLIPKEKNLKIRFAVSLRSGAYMEGGQSSVQLRSFKCEDGPSLNKDADDKKELDVDKEMNEQTALFRLRMQLQTIGDRLTEKQQQCVALEKTNHVLRDERDTVHKRLKQLQTTNSQIQKSEEEEKGKDSKEESIVGMQKQMQHLQQEWNDFMAMHSLDKLRALFYASDDEYITEHEMNAFHLQLKSFDQYLTNTKTFLRDSMQPSVEHYQQWNVKEIMQWISGLENGRFCQYIKTLKQGFENDNIDGTCLPDVTQQALRSEPFCITDFKDRRELAAYFKALPGGYIHPPSQQVVNAAAYPGDPVYEEMPELNSSEGVETAFFG